MTPLSYHSSNLSLIVLEGMQLLVLTSFINSETTALLHLTSFTEDVTNIGFHMPIWEIFSEFLRFCNLFHKALGE